MLHDYLAFCSLHNIAVCTFGRKACGDPRLISDLRRGRELRSRTAERIRQFMESYDANP